MDACGLTGSADIGIIAGISRPPTAESAAVTLQPNLTQSAQQFVRGAYIVATRDWRHGGERVCTAGELALVFGVKRGASGTADVLLENGRTLNGVDKQSLAGAFRVVHVEPDFVICGCSSHEGWDKARALLSQSP